jgi:tetratricopeptide (TPR) repeat protein
MFTGNIYMERGDPDRAILCMEESIRLGEQAGFRGVQVGTRADLGWVYGSLGVVDRGRDIARLALAKAVKQLPFWRSWPLAVLARLHTLHGDHAAAAEAVQEGYAHLSRAPFTTAIFLLPLADAELALATADYARVIAVTDALVAATRQRGARTFIPDALHSRGRALAMQGRLDEALDVVGAACAQAEELGSRRALWPILLSLAEIEAQRGRADEAESLRQRARETITYVADHIADARLRESFLRATRLPTASGIE